MSDALDALIEAVEAGGDRDDWMPWIDPFDRTRGLLPYKFNQVPNAYRGSLDAALALHEALLPGWGGVAGTDGLARVYKGGRVQTVTEFARINGQPARAWLLAILRAYREARK